MSGHRLQRSSSFEPLSTRNDDDSSGDEGPSPRGGVSLRRTTSMSPLKHSFSFDSPPVEDAEDGEKEKEAGEESEKSADTDHYLIPEEEDDVFVNRTPGDYPGKKKRSAEEAVWPTSPEHFNENSQVARAMRTPIKYDPQGIYPPEACVFAANLKRDVNNDTLLREVTRSFSKYCHPGLYVHVKLRRDGKDLPFAFVQFETKEEADAAIADPNDMVLFGRKVRKERANANSVFLIAKRRGSALTEEEVLSVMDPLGPVSNIDFLPEKGCYEVGVPPGAAVVYFEKFDSRRNVLANFRGQATYNVFMYNADNPTPVTPHATAIRNSRQEQFDQYDADRRSAYLGNLPTDMTEEWLSKLLEGYDVFKITLNRKPINNGNEFAVFAFVEFHRHDDVHDLISRLDGSVVGDRMIKVAQKRSMAFTSPLQTRPYRPSPPADRPLGLHSPSAPSHLRGHSRSSYTGPSGYTGQGWATPSSARGRGGPARGQYTPTGPSGRGGRGGSLGRASGGNMMAVSPSPAGRGASRSSVRETFTTPTRPVSKFSSDSSDESDSPVRGEQPPPAVAGPSKPRSPKPEESPASEHDDDGPSSSDRMFHLSLEDDDPTPKGKGKEPVRPIHPPLSTPKKTAPSAAKRIQPETTSEQQLKTVVEAHQDAPAPSDAATDSGPQNAQAGDHHPGDRGSYEADDERETHPRPMPTPASEYPPATYAMPSGYTATHLTAYGNPSMGWATPNPYAPPFHPAVMGPLMGYPPEFIWSGMPGVPSVPYMSPYMGGGMPPPPMPGPPPTGRLPSLPPTPSRSGGSGRRGGHGHRRAHSVYRVQMPPGEPQGEPQGVSSPERQTEPIAESQAEGDATEDSEHVAQE